MKSSVGEQKAILEALAQSTAAWLVGMNPRTFRDADAPRNTDGSYSGPALVEWVKSKPVAAGDDPLLAGDSPSLERYRAARADLAEMEAAERRGRLVDVDVFAEWWVSEVAMPIRRAIETLGVRFGPDAAALMADAVSKAEASIEQRSGAVE